MSDAPERIWVDPELIDSPRKTLACNFATADQGRSLPTDVEYVRADHHAAEVEALRKESERLRETLTWISGTSKGTWDREGHQHCVERARAALQGETP